MGRFPVKPLPADYSKSIPGQVYWAPLSDNFYSAEGQGMGTEFYAQWYTRRAEFPQGEAWGFGHGSQHNPFKDDAPLTPDQLVKGERYNWKSQPERLIYMGMCEPRNGRWHQFALVEKPDEVWCEVLPSDMHRLEKTKA